MTEIDCPECSDVLEWDQKEMTVWLRYTCKKSKEDNNSEKKHRDLLFTLYTRTVRVALQELFQEQLTTKKQTVNALIEIQSEHCLNHRTMNML